MQKRGQRDDGGDGDDDEDDSDSSSGSDDDTSEDEDSGMDDAILGQEIRRWKKKSRSKMKAKGKAKAKAKSSRRHKCCRNCSRACASLENGNLGGGYNVDEYGRVTDSEGNFVTHLYPEIAEEVSWSAPWDQPEMREIDPGLGRRRFLPMRERPLDDGPALDNTHVRHDGPGGVGVRYSGRDPDGLGIGRSASSWRRRRGVDEYRL